MHIQIAATNGAEPEQDERAEYGRGGRPKDVPYVPHDDHAGADRSHLGVAAVRPNGQADGSRVFATHRDRRHQSGVRGHVAGQLGEGR